MSEGNIFIHDYIMKLQFNISDAITVHLDRRTYNVFIVGGFYIKASEDFYIKIDSPNKIITVKKKRFRTRCFKNGGKAVKYFEFDVDVPGEYFISARNTGNLEIKSSQLMTRSLFQKPISRDKIDLLIEKK